MKLIIDISTDNYIGVVVSIQLSQIFPRQGSKTLLSLLLKLSTLSKMAQISKSFHSNACRSLQLATRGKLFKVLLP